jgi:uncharacterized protein (TIGR03437 family)
VLFGTGIRNRARLENVRVYFGDAPSQGLFAGKQGSFDGLDQINVEIPKTLAGAARDLNVLVTVDGKTANPVTLKIK